MTRGVRTTARKIFSPRVIQCLLALLVAAASIGLAVVCWKMGEFLVGVAAAGFIYFGLLFAWELIPFSEQTRERCAYHRKLSERYWPYRWRFALWIGLVWGAIRLLEALEINSWDPWVFLFPVAYIVSGIFAYGMWHQHLRRQTSQPHSGCGPSA